MIEPVKPLYMLKATGLFFFTKTKEKTMIKIGCYVATNKKNGKQYVGKAMDYDKRLYSHKWRYNHKNPKYNNIHPKFYRAIRKHGWEAFSWQFYHCWDDMLVEFEQSLIAACDSFKNGYNCTEGGDGTIGYRNTDEAKKKVGDANRGRVKSADTLAKMSKATQGSKNGFYGKTHNAETRQKIIESNKRRAKTKEINYANEII